MEHVNMSNELIEESSAPSSFARFSQDPDLKSPLFHFDAGTESDRVFAGEGLTITERVGLELVIARGIATDPAFAAAVLANAGSSVPRVPNTTATSGTHTTIWLGPDEWLIRSHAPNAHSAGVSQTYESLAAQFKCTFACAVDVGSGYTTLRLEGRLWADTLARGCPLDLEELRVRGNFCAQSHFFKAPLLLVGVDENVVDVIVRRSFAEYMTTMLQDAAQSACDYAIQA
jgi:sarcosine oxidase, subunit gamma